MGGPLGAMLFPTFTFAVFFALVMTVGWLLHGRPPLWKLFMLVASYVFYGYWDVRFVALILASTVINQILAVAVHHSKVSGLRSALTAVAVVANLSVLGFFKYYGFFVDSIGKLGPLAPSLPILEIVLPVGISFFTFQALSYVIDVRRRVIRPASPVDFAVYLAFFPQLVAGPIVRASEFLPQLRARRDPRDIDFTRAMCLIGAGMFKKVVISSYLAGQIVDDAFANPDRFSAIEILMAIYGYAIQIYADFSGYTDMAIGIALLLGLKFPDNFDRPYASLSIQDFWRRWHMTLSRWLRDYLYIGLGGNRGGLSRRDRNLFLTMLLGGLWHGAAWTFVIWGAYQGLGLIVERKRMEQREDGDGGSDLQPSRGVPVGDADGGGGLATMTRPKTAATGTAQSSLNLAPVGQWLATFHFVAIGWVFFRADSMGTAFDVLSRLVMGWTTPSTALSPLLFLTIAAALAVQFVPKGLLAAVRSDVSTIPVPLQALAFGAWLMIIDLLGPDGVAPFIYFQF